MIRSIFHLIALVAVSGGFAAAAAAPDFETRILARHNAERARIGVPLLTWDTGLAHDAAAWARHLAVTRRFEHAPDTSDAMLQGENLWMGTANAFAPEDMVDGWIHEKIYYRPGYFPKVTITSDWSDVGHYTQLIWAGTTRVGCAMATGGGNDVLVCRYSPAGNWDGEDPVGSTTVRTASLTPAF